MKMKVEVVNHAHHRLVALVMNHVESVDVDEEVYVDDADVDADDADDVDVVDV